MKATIAKNTQDMILVAQVFESGSISAACHAIGLERTSLSRRLKELEGRVGIRLFDRSGQSIQLTKVGSTYLQYCHRVRELVEEAESCITGKRLLETGLLHITADFEEAGQLLSPVIDAYVAKHSNAEVVITLAAGRLPRIPDEADVVLQTSVRRERGVQYHQVAVLERSVWASPSLAESESLAEDPTLPQSLPVLGLSDATDGSETWRLASGDRVADIPVLPRFRMSTLVEVREACLAGLGIAVLPDYLCVASAKNQQLVRAFPKWHPPPLQLIGSHLRSSEVPRRARTFIEFCANYDFGSNRSSPGGASADPISRS